MRDMLLSDYNLINNINDRLHTTEYINRGKSA